MEVTDSNMSKKKTDPQEETRRISLRGLFDNILSTLETEIGRLPDTLQEVNPEKRLDFISKNLPLLLKYRESGEGSDSWLSKWGD